MQNGNHTEEFSDLVRSARAQAEGWLSAGLDGVPGRKGKRRREETVPEQRQTRGGPEEVAGELGDELEQEASTPEGMQESLDFGSPDLESAHSPEEALQKLKAEVVACKRCAELAAMRTQIVFGQGNPRAELVFVGEAPGEEEDKQGLAFVGRAGQLLTDIVTKAMKMQREDVYICNILKCRPPDNRNPLPQEIINCMPYLLRQLEIIRPKIICALGSVATQVLLEKHEPIGRMRGKFYPYHGMKVLPTYHPAYVLRNYTYDTRKKVYEDVIKIVAELTPHKK